MSADSYYNDNSGNRGQYGQHQPPPYGQNQGYQNQGYEGQDGGETGERGFMGALAGGAAGAFGGAKIGGKATGHAKTSGVIGAIAGAIAGSKLQDGVHDWKEDRDDRKEDERRRREDEERRRRDDDRYDDRRDDRYDDRRDDRYDDRRDDRYNDRRDDRRDDHRDDHSYSGSRGGGGGGGGHYAGAFSSSARDIRLDNDNGEWNLRASCGRGDGSYQSSTISLNRILGNNNGSFQWSSGGGGGGGFQSVTVQQGDTLRAIAGRFGCSFEDIARHNNISNPDMIYPGQNLQIPGGGGGGSSSGGNFGASARDVRLRDGVRLEASLCRQGGDWVTSSINLDERIGNENGTLRFI